MTNPPPILEIKNLTKEFTNIRAVDDTSITIHKGEIVFIVGPSGSGKSTFLRCINQLETPTSGTISYHGQLVGHHATDLNKFRENVGMVFQHFNLFPHLTIQKNITLAPVLTKQMTQEEADQLATSLLARINLSDKANVYPNQLSGGQKQRIAIIRALAMKPEIILFDEPTSALDPEMVGEVQSLMKDLAKDGITMIVVTHGIEFAKEAASRLIFMDHGKIIADDTPENIIYHSENPRIRDFFSKISHT